MSKLIRHFWAVHIKKDFDNQQENRKKSVIKFFIESTNLRTVIKFFIESSNLRNVLNYPQIFYKRLCKNVYSIWNFCFLKNLKYLNLPLLFKVIIATTELTATFGKKYSSILLILCSDT